MFAVFREWWILRQLRKRCRKSDARFVEYGQLDFQSHHEIKDNFLKDITKNFLWLFPRCNEWQNRRYIKDLKILNNSLNRIPPLIEEKANEQWTREVIIRGGGDPNLVRHIDTKDAQRPVIKTTGTGDNFTFPVAFTEFWRKYINTFWSFLVLIITAIVGSNYLVIFKDFISKLFHS